MTNLTIDRDGDFKFRNREEGKLVEVTVEYVKSENINRRGVFVYVTPKTVKQEDSYTSVSFNLMDRNAIRTLVLQMPRKTPKLTASIAAKIDAIAPKLCELVEAEQKAEALALIAETLAKQVVA